MSREDASSRLKGSLIVLKATTKAPATETGTATAQTRQKQVRMKETYTKERNQIIKEKQRTGEKGNICIRLLHDIRAVIE